MTENNDNVISIPTEYKRPVRVKGEEIHAQIDPPQEMVWEVCPYTRSDGSSKGCRQCPEWEDSKRGKCQRMCYSMAKEACKVVFAMQEQEKIKLLPNPDHK